GQGCSASGTNGFIAGSLSSSIAANIVRSGIVGCNTSEIKGTGNNNAVLGTNTGSIDESDECIIIGSSNEVITDCGESVLLGGHENVLTTCVGCSCVSTFNSTITNASFTSTYATSFTNL